jgi:hypothetical protein
MRDTFVMVDLETMGTSFNAAILAVGAVYFEHGRFNKSFHSNVDLKSSVELGLNIEPETVMWWMGQEHSARLTQKENPLPITTVLDAFADWVNWIPNNENLEFYGNSASFDLGILGNAYDLYKKERPWMFWNERCYRTIKNNYYTIQPDPFEGTPHVAVDDAMNQAKHLVKIINFPRICTI